MSGRAYRNGRRQRLAALAALLLALGLAPAGGAAQELPKEVVEAARREGKVMIYGSLESEVMKAVEEAFQSKYGIRTEYWRASSTKVMDRVLTETRAGRPLFDVVLTNATPMRILKEHGAFGRFDVPAVAAYAQNLRDPDGVLSPPYRVVLVSVLYNTRLVKPDEAPRTLRDLLEPKWQGKIAMPDPTRHSTTTTWLANLDKALGKDASAFVQGLAAQRPVMVESFIPSVQKVISGEVPLGVTYIKYVHVFGKEGAPLDYVRLKPVLGDAHLVGLGAKAPNPNAARVFANFFISQEGLKLLASQGEFVLVKGIYPPIKDAEKLEIMAMDDLSEDDLKKWTQEFRRVFFAAR